MIRSAAVAPVLSAPRLHPAASALRALAVAVATSAVAPALTACAAGAPESVTQPGLPPGPVTFLEGDFAGAMSRAAEERRLLFVDAWAPWCHTCLSMRDVVLASPELARFERDYVFAAIDTDREESAAFLERYRMRVWPTFFVIDPESGSVLAMHGGSMSLTETKQLLTSAAVRGRGADRTPGGAARARAHQAYVERDPARAAALYEEAAGLVGDARRTEALLGGARAWSEAADPKRCVAFGRSHADAVRGSSAPADFLYYVRDCSKKLEPGAEREEALAWTKGRLLSLAERPPDGASADDRADVLSMAAEAARESGDLGTARALDERRSALLDAAAKEARTPEEAQVFDYARLGAYVALDRAADAVAMLEERVKQLPESYEAHARLASALLSAKREKDAVVALDRAVSLSYGPRRLRYLAQKAEVLAKIGDAQGARAALEAEVRGWRELPAGQADAARLEDAERRLAGASAGVGEKR